MKRIFLRLWLVAVALFVLGMIVNQVFFWLVFSSEEQAYLEKLMSGGHRMAAERVRTADDRARVLAELEGFFGFPVAVLDRDEVSDDVRARLDAGAAPAWVVLDTEEYYFTAIDATDEVLRVGPHSAFPLPELVSRVILLGFAAGFFALAFGWILRPLQRSQRALERTAEDIAAGNLDARVPTEDMAAAPAMAAAFNRMAEQVGELIGNQQEILQVASHELRTPIARLRIGVHLLATAMDDREARAEALDADLEELDQLVEELLTYARMDAERSRGKPESLLVREVVERVVDKQAVLAHEITICTGAGLAEGVDGPRVTAVAKLFERVLDNLVGNARRYAQSQVVVDARLADEDGNQANGAASWLDITIDDDGPGIAPAERTRVLLPFLRLDDKSGHGMGLAIVDRIVKGHDGVTLVEESPLGGCRIRTRWPAHYKM